MTHLLKFEGADESVVRSLDFRAPTPARSPEAQRLSALEGEIENLQQRLRQAEAARLSDVEAARQAGALAASETFHRNEEAARDILSRALGEAVAHLNTHFAHADRLALTLALAALEKLLASPERYRELLSDAIGVQLVDLRQDTVTAIALSAHDFADDDALQALGAKIGADIHLSRDAALDAGQCRMSLRLGAIDISLGDYWSRLEARCRGLVSGQAP